MPSASNSLTIDRPPQAVFDFVADGTSAPRWRPGIVDVALESGSGLGARYRQGVKGPGGRRIDADYEIAAYEPPGRLAFVGTAGPVRPTGEYRFEAVDGGTRVTFTLSAEVTGLKGLVMGRAVQATMNAEVASLTRLKALLEAEPKA